MTMRSTMRGLFGWLSAKSKTQHRARRPNSANRRFRARLAGCEPLEDRRLLAGDGVLQSNVPPHAEWANVSTSTDTPLDVTVLDRVNDPDHVREFYSLPCISISLCGNALGTYPEIAPSTVTVQQAPLHGSTSVDLETGIVTYTPDPGFTGDDFFFYTVKDRNNAFSNQGRISITVDAAERPYKNPWERFDVNADKKVNSLDLLAIIQDVQEQPSRILELPLSTEPTSYVDVNGDGVMNALDMVQMFRELNAIAAGRPNSGPQLTTPLNDIVVDEDAADIVINLHDFFGDADLASGDLLSFAIVERSVLTSVFSERRIDIDGTFVLKLNPNRWGSDTFTLRATDSLGAFVEDTFTIDVLSVPDTPTVVVEIGDKLIAVDSEPEYINLTSIFQDGDRRFNKLSPEGDSLAYQIVNNSDPTVVSTIFAGSWLMLKGHQQGSADITVRATDSLGLWVETTFTVTATTDVIFDASDLSYFTITNSSNGVLRRHAIGGFDVSYTRTAKSYITLDNGIGLQAINLDIRYDTELLDLTDDDVVFGSLVADSSGWQLIVDVDDELGVAHIAIFSPAPLDVARGQLLELKFTDPNYDTQTGAILLPSNGETFITPVEITGPDSFGDLDFRYSNGSISDRSLSSFPSSKLTQRDYASTEEDTPVEIDILGNDSGVLSSESWRLPIDPQSVTIVVAPEHGTLDIEPMTGIVTYLPEPGFAVIDSFIYEVSDTEGNAGQIAVATIDVFAVNDQNVAPVVVQSEDITARTDRASTEIDLANIFHDADGDTLTYSLLVNNCPSYATVELTDENSLVITGLQRGITQVTIRAIDPSGASTYWAFSVEVDRSITFSTPRMTVHADEETFTIPINVDDATGLQEFSIDVRYYASRFDLVASDIQLDGLLADAGGWSLTSSIETDNDYGIAHLTFSAQSPLEGGSGTIASLTFMLRSDIQAGGSDISLSGPAAAGDLLFLYGYERITISND